MSHRHEQTADRNPNQADAMVGCRPVSPSILAIAMLLALTASVAAAGAIEGSDPSRFDRREAPRELTVRWLTDAVAKAARDLASTEAEPIKPAARLMVTATGTITESMRSTSTASRDRSDPDSAMIAAMPEQGLINLPPPALR